MKSPALAVDAGPPNLMKLLLLLLLHGIVLILDLLHVCDGLAQLVPLPLRDSVAAEQEEEADHHLDGHEEGVEAQSLKNIQSVRDL